MYRGVLISATRTAASAAWRQSGSLPILRRDDRGGSDRHDRACVVEWLLFRGWTSARSIYSTLTATVPSSSALVSSTYELQATIHDR
jgi:hypothetical protein